MHVVIAGGGIAGLTVAWRSLARGLDVTVADPAPGSGATRVAAGMLTPVSELTYGEERLMHLGIASRDRYREFVDELEEVSGLGTGYRADGILEVAFDADDLAFLDDLRRFHESLGVRSQALSARECRELEPLLAPRVRGGLLAPDDGSVDPRRLTEALLVAIRRTGGTMISRRVTEVLITGGRASGVRLHDGTEIPADQVVIAAGCHAHQIAGVPPEELPPIRPVKGQVLRLRTRGGPFLTRCIRGVVRGSSVYILPRANGEVVIGATQEELGFDTAVTAGGMWQLLRDAREIVPGVSELAFAEANAGLRPGSPDNAPLLGPTDLPGLLLAAGHFRNGILLAPITGDVIAHALETGALPEVAAPFAPRRFKENRAAASGPEPRV